ncbi:putative mitochondrial protein AtMg00240 [Silene latifolia]|uniref:putative mitochondrial protein AtMg00240 n=1 Tax=Silene latifolia TaxID=37657 RepID=UPI003D77D928
MGAKPAYTPIAQNHELSLSTSPLLKDPLMYMRLVGRLVYLTITRPDLLYAVHVLSQFVQSPRKDHWEAAIRVVKYLKGDPGKGIVMRKDAKLQLNGYSDSDYARCPLTRRSLTGYFVALDTTPISWKVRK